VLLWAAADELDDRAAELITDGSDEVFVSPATIWEIEIKRRSGRLETPGDLIEMVAQSGFAAMPITFEHAREAARLPLHHHDPFDRMLVAQSRIEGLTLATADATLSRYDVPLLSVARA
jgi:PIN domain nuclease of toxin-antitoxin system